MEKDLSGGSSFAAEFHSEFVSLFIFSALFQFEYVGDGAFLDGGGGGADVECGFECGFFGCFPEAGVLDGCASVSGGGAGYFAVVVNFDSYDYGARGLDGVVGHG